MSHNTSCFNFNSNYKLLMMKLKLLLLCLLIGSAYSTDPRLESIPLNSRILEIITNFLKVINDVPVYLKDALNLNIFLNTPEYRIKELPAQEYDFIIVGSGSAGSAIANRLSEVKKWNVLLLEAGEPEGPIQSIPSFCSLFQLTKYSWDYHMEYEPTSGLGFENVKMFWPRGKALGGTSTINYMIYTRGNPHDFERWSKNNPGWSYKEVLPYYLKSEGASMRNIDEKYHNKKGPLSVEHPFQTGLLQNYLEAGKELGYPTIDYNSPEKLLGFAQVQATVKHGLRHSVAKAFLYPIQNRANLDIITSAYVTKILINATTKEAYGVRFERLGRKFTVKARKEVILSAGTFNSPQLLMLSGIGPENRLQELKIPVIKNLPVGQNLHDHLCFPGVTFSINKDINFNVDDTLNPISFLELLLKGTGPLSFIGGVDGLGYIKTEVAKYKEDYPDIELIFVGGTLTLDYGTVTRTGFRIRDDVYYPVFGPLKTEPDWQMFPMLLHPKSIGNLTITSTNPYAPPLLHGNYFTDPEKHDIKTFIAAIRFIEKISETKVFQKLGSRINPSPIPGCENYKFDSDDYWECSLRVLAVTLHHQVGTCKMGPKNDSTSVVDNELKVHGVKNLRVADSSVIPFALSAHTNAPAVMVGEKASDFIKKSWGVPIRVLSFGSR